MLKPELRSEERYGMLLASVLFMGLSFNEAVDQTPCRNSMKRLGKLSSRTLNLAFSVFLFLGYLVALYILLVMEIELG